MNVFFQVFNYLQKKLFKNVDCQAEKQVSLFHFIHCILFGAAFPMTFIIFNDIKVVKFPVEFSYLNFLLKSLRKSLSILLSID